METRYHHYYFVQTIEGTEPNKIMLGKETLWLATNLELFCEELKFIDADPLDYYLEYAALNSKGTVVYCGSISFATHAYRVRYEQGFALVDMKQVKLVERSYLSRKDLLCIELQFVCRNEEKIGESLRVMLYGYSLETIRSPFPLTQEQRSDRIVPSKMNDIENDPF